MNRDYLNHIRKNSAYPTFRGFVTFFTVVGDVVAVLVAIGCLFTGGGGIGVGGVVLGLLGAVVLALFVTVAREVSLMLADIADATINFTGSHSDAFKSSVSYDEKNL
jgi:drug/metabolite transporter (DMT)-like permease